MKVVLTDLMAHRALIGDRIDAALLEVASSGRWIMGPAVDKLESELSAFTGASHTVTCSNGTDALLMGLLALGVRPGDGVVCPTFTFAATAEAIAFIGAVPIFADIEADGFNICLESTESAVAVAQSKGIPVVGIIAVDLFGLAADYRGLRSIADANGLWVLADGAQGFGCEVDGRRVGALDAEVSTTSFFPAKPLGCYGDGGAVFTEDAAVAERLRSLRVHGKGSDKYDNVRIGLNARLDPMQAVVLSEKLAIFDQELDGRRRAAMHYSDALGDVVEVPRVPGSMAPAWAQYTVRVPNRDAVQDSLSGAGIGTAVYYPLPLHRQTAYSGGAGVGLTGCERAELASEQVLSLPMHPYLDDDQLGAVVDAVRAAVEPS